MQQNPDYEDLIKEVLFYFSEKVAMARKKGINDIIVDPGFGFGKTLAHNYELLNKLELFDRKDHLPSQMSGGEQQRVSIARSLANNPDILLADEPTGNLDSKTADIVFNQFLDLAKDENMSVLLATHNIKLSDKSDRVISLQNGSLLEG